MVSGIWCFSATATTDAVWAQRLALLLKPVVVTGRLSLWVDTDLRAGQAWQDGIDAAIARSRAALLLVSAEYLGSEFIMTRELPALIEQRVRLLPVLVGDCLWRHVPSLARVQWLHDPGRDGPLDAIRRAGRRNQRLRQICDRLLVEIPPAAVSPEAAVVPAPVGMPDGPVEVVESVSAVAGRLVGVPGLPPGYAVRHELAELIAAVTATTGGGAVGVTGEVSPLGLHGQGGIGKSVLAAALARDEAIRRRFPDGIFWVTVGNMRTCLPCSWVCCVGSTLLVGRRRRWWRRPRGCGRCWPSGGCCGCSPAEPVEREAGAS